MSDVLWAVAAVLFLVLVMAGIGLGRPLLARMAGRNLRRRKSRVAIAVLGLLVGTAIISSSLVVGDTLDHIFVQDVYDRLGAVDETVSSEFNGNLISFNESVVPVLRAGLAARDTPIDGLAATLLKTMPVRNVAGNKGSQAVTVMGIDDAQEAGFGDVTDLAGAVLRTSALPAGSVYLNERAARDLNASAGQNLTLFYGTTNQTLVGATVAGVARDLGTANWDKLPIVLMGLRAAQAAFNETGAVNLVRVSNRGGVEDGLAVTDDVVRDARLVIGANRWDLAVSPVKADGVRDAEELGSDATQLFLVMGAFSVVAGLLLIVNIFVMMAEERKAEMGVSRAIGLQRTDLTAAFLLEGAVFAVAAAALGALAGLALGYVMIYIFGIVVPVAQGIQVSFYFEPASVVLAFAAGATMTFGSVAVASWRIGRLNVVRAIRDLPEPKGHHGGLALALGLVLALVGIVATVAGFLYDVDLGKIGGVPALAVGLAALASLRVPVRYAMTLAGLVDLAWHLGPWHFVTVTTDNAAVLFVAIGLLLVLGGILVAVFNAAPALKALLVRGGRRRGRPAARIAMSYPTERPFRTGMTLAMFALILFTVTVISMVQALEDASVAEYIQQQSGGYDVIAYTGTYGEIPDFRRTLNDSGLMPYFRGGENGVSSATVLPAKVDTPDGKGPYDYTLWGIDNFLIQSNQYAFHSHLPYILDSTGVRIDLVTREDVWRALSLNTSYAVVDRTAEGPSQFVLPGGGLRVQPGDRVRVFDGHNNSANLTIVGVLEQALQFTSGIFVDRSVVRDRFVLAETFTAYFFQVAPGNNVQYVRTELERVFFAYGLRTIDIREQVGQAFDAAQKVLTLMQAYLGIGLMVGIAGLGVVTARAVVERRQQIGALRAIGFTQGMVLRAFLLEIAFVALLGIFVGMALGIVLAYKVFSIFFADFVTFTIPWVNLGVITLVALVATVAATASPAVRASKIPPAEALRYIE